MTPAELVRADHEAMLIVGSFVAAQQDPASFERFVDRMLNEWQRRADADAANRLAATDAAVNALGRIQANRGAQPGLDTASVNNNPAPTENTVGSTGKTV